MSRYYIYDSFNDSVAEFKEYRQGRSKKGTGTNTTARYTPPGGVKPGDVRVQGDQQGFRFGPRSKMNPLNRKGGALTDLMQDPSNPFTMRNNAKFLEGLKAKKALIRNLGIGGGVLATGGAIAGGAYMMNKRNKNKAAAAAAAKERNSIKGRVKSLLGR